MQKAQPGQALGRKSPQVLAATVADYETLLAMAREVEPLIGSMRAG